MKIGIDLAHIAEGESGGLVPFLETLLTTAFLDYPQHEFVVFGTPANQKLFTFRSTNVQNLTLDSDHYYPLLSVGIAALGVDVLLSAYPMEAEIEFPAERRIVVVPDCQQEHFPEFFEAETLRSRRNAFHNILQHAGAILTLSNHAQHSILNCSSTRCSDVFISTPALRGSVEQPALEQLTPEERKLLPECDFFLYPANLWPHKNHRRVLAAFQEFVKSYSRPIEFIFTGHPQGWDELRKEFPALPIRHLGFVRRQFLQVLLARARALVFFSLYEGFGMPLLEAFAAGTPVVCSNTTSLPEVGGDAVVTCDPTDTAAMCACLSRVITDAQLRNRMIARGRERLAFYNWHTSAAELIAACERVRARAAGSAVAPLRALRTTLQVIQDIQADRAARLAVINVLDRALYERPQRTADQDEQRPITRADDDEPRSVSSHLKAAWLGLLNKRWFQPVKWPLQLVRRCVQRGSAGSSER